jgi:hypothetical protein
MSMPLNMFEWLCRKLYERQSRQLKLNGYAEDSRRDKYSTYVPHKHSALMFMPLNMFGINIQLEWLCRRQSTG